MLASHIDTRPEVEAHGDISHLFMWRYVFWGSVGSDVEGWDMCVCVCVLLEDRETSLQETWGMHSLALKLLVGWYGDPLLSLKRRYVCYTWAVGVKVVRRSVLRTCNLSKLCLVCSVWEYGVLCMGVHMWYMAMGSVWGHGARALFGSMVCSGLCVHICVFIYMYQHIYMCLYLCTHNTCKAAATCTV